MWEHRVEELITPHECHVHEVTEVIASGRTARQAYEIVRLGGYGRALLIEGRVQSTEADEAIYHEALILPGYCLLPHTRRVLSLGGANGGVLHRLCALPEVREVVQIDVDEELHHRSVELLAHMHRGAHTDPRCEVEFGDPRTRLGDQDGRFDLILADLPDAIDGSVTTTLFTREFYELVREKLASHGVFVTQAGPAHPLDPEFFASVSRTLGLVFRHILPYVVAVPSFGIPWGFVIASDELDPAALTAAKVDRKLAAMRVPAECYDGTTHQHMTALPRQLRIALATAGRAISDASTLSVRI
jgi:spermidine synthase